MKTIKFRGKRIDNLEWVYGIPINTHMGDYIITEENPHVCSLYGYMEIDEFCQVDLHTIEQFTGLYDRNGTEIYEGDILDFNGLNIEVRFVRGVFALLCNGDLDQEMCGDCRTDLFATVIGNIHDNPELLKGGEK